METSHLLRKEVLDSKEAFFYVDLSKVRYIISNLKFLYHSMVASENLLRCAASVLETNITCEYEEQLYSYYRGHIDEERGHDKWLADDLRAHGVDINDNNAHSMAMVGSQYYMIYHKHPASLLGYLCVSEGTPTPIREIEKMEKIYGPRLFRCARFHAIKDQEHKVELFHIIDQSPQKLHDVIFESARNCLDYIKLSSSSWH